MNNLRTNQLGRYFLPLDEVDSTNTYCKNHADELPHGAVVTALRQTAGKGRLGRQWADVPDAGLAMSILLHDVPPQKISLFPLLTGLAVSEGLEQLTGLHCPIKWSNDVLIGEKKLCGILCESRLTGTSGFAVIGIGVNLAQSAEDFAQHALVYASSLLLATGRRFSREEVMVSILNRLEPVLITYTAEGFSGDLLERYKQRCITLGRNVRIIREGKEQTGLATDIDPDGALVCIINGKKIRVLAGEASVRGLYGYV